MTGSSLSGSSLAVCLLAVVWLVHQEPLVLSSDPPESVALGRLTADPGGVSVTLMGCLGYPGGVLVTLTFGWVIAI